MLSVLVLSALLPEAPAAAVCLPGVACPGDPLVPPPEPGPDPQPQPGSPPPSSEPAPPPEPEPEPAPAFAVDGAAAERLRRLVDGERGAAPFAARADLDAEAAAHAERMARDGEIFHNDDLFTPAARRRLGAKRIGENVALNTSVEDAHRRLMASPGHRANIVDPQFGAAGIGVVRDHRGRLFIVEVMIDPVTSEGSPSVSSPASAPAAATATAKGPRSRPAVTTRPLSAVQAVSAVSASTSRSVGVTASDGGEGSGPGAGARSGSAPPAPGRVVGELAAPAGEALGRGAGPPARGVGATVPAMAGALVALLVIAGATARQARLLIIVRK